VETHQTVTIFMMKIVDIIQQQKPDVIINMTKNVTETTLSVHVYVVDQIAPWNKSAIAKAIAFLL